MTTTTDKVLVALDGHVLRITINAPDRLNAVDEPMLLALRDAVSDPAPEARVIVLRGAGRAFSSGADLQVASDLAENTGAETIDAANALVAAMVSSALPIVTVVQGPCVGVGVPIALAGDVTLASEDGYFQLAFTKIGLMPDGGTSAIVAASVGRARAIRMAMLAERIGATEAERIGLIGRVVPAVELEETLATIVAQLASGPAVAYQRTKEAINAMTLGHTLPDAFRIEREGQIGLLASADFTEGARSFTERRAPAFSDLPTPGERPA